MPVPGLLMFGTRVGRGRSVSAVAAASRRRAAGATVRGRGLAGTESWQNGDRGLAGTESWQNGDRGLADAESRQSTTPTSCKGLGPESGRIPYKR